MTSRSIGFPSSPSLNDEYKKWTWDGDKWTVSAFVDYDDSELRALISANSTRIDALENSSSVDAYTKAESDGKYQLIGNYALVGASYTKAESDNKWQPSGNYALVGASYTKSESDSAYVPKTGNTTINGTLTAKDMVATG
jgi:hypothetical protein